MRSTISMCLLSYSFVLFFLFNWIVWVMIVLYIFWIQVLCQITGYKYFFPSCGFSVLSTLSSDEKEVLILMKPNLWTFLSWLILCFLFKKSLPTPKSWRCYLLLLFFYSFIVTALMFRSMIHFELIQSLLYYLVFGRDPSVNMQLLQHHLLNWVNTQLNPALLCIELFWSLV